MVLHDVFIATAGGTRLGIMGRKGMHFGGSLVNQGQQGREWDVRIAQNVIRNTIHQIGEVIGKDTCHVQAFTVVLVCLIDMGRDSQCQ